MSVRYITDGGMETDLIFNQGIDLPHFASFALLDDEAGRRALREYFLPYIDIARDHDVGIVLDTPTWRANADWGERLGYSADALDRVNRDAVDFLVSLREKVGSPPQIVVSGCVGPRGDGYRVDAVMTADDAERYHRPQVEIFADSAVDQVSGLTMTYVEEAIGIVRAAAEQGLPVVISFTVETDGRLPSGQPLREAVEQADAETDGAPAYFMINCAHPSHFLEVLAPPAPWLERVHGVRANASRQSHAELDEAEALDDGDPLELAQEYAALRERLPNLAVAGGCCGTDHRHVREIAAMLAG